MNSRTFAIWAACAAGILIASSSIGQAPPTSNTRLEKDIADLRARIDELEKRAPSKLTSASLPFELRDAKGKTRFRFVAGGSDNPAILWVMDGDGKPRVGLSAQEETGNFQLYDADGEVAVNMTSEDYSGSLVVRHSDGRSVEVHGGRGVSVRDEKRAPQAQLFTDGKSGWVNVYGGTQGLAVVQMYSISTGAGRLKLSDGQGRVLLDAGMATDGAGVLRMGPNGNGPAGIVNGKVASELQGRTN